MIQTKTAPSPLGPIFLAAREGALIGLWLEGQEQFLGAVRNEEKEEADSEIFRQTSRWLERYFAGERPEPRELRLAPEGTRFQRRVWEILLEIPYGQTTTYGKIAARLAAEQGRARMSAQAVGGAVGRNPISIIIPCHRVIGANGSLTGYAGGIDKKIRLLTLEGVEWRR